MEMLGSGCSKVKGRQKKRFFENFFCCIEGSPENSQFHLDIARLSSLRLNIDYSTSLYDFQP